MLSRDEGISHLNHVVLLLQSDLRQTAGQQLVHIVVYAHGHLNELHPVRARQTLAVWKGRQTEQGIKE